MRDMRSSRSVARSPRRLPFPCHAVAAVARPSESMTVALTDTRCAGSWTVGCWITKIRVRREGPCPSTCSMPPVVAARPRPCLGSTLAGLRATRACAIRPIHRPSRRSSPFCGDTLHGQRLRGLIILLWRAGLGISDALALAESDLDARRGAVLVRRGKGGRRREVGMDDWAWQELQPWLASRLELPVGPLFCITAVRRADGHGPA